MLALALAATLAISPRPLPNADSGVYVPRIDRLGGLIGFMERAGERSVMLRPSTWFSQFHPLLYVDFTRPESLRANGIDTAGSATVSFRKDGWMSCVEVADLHLFEQRARERLASFGTVSEGRRGAIAVVTAKASDGAVRAGYAKKGHVTCSIVASNNGDGMLGAAVAAVSNATLEGAWKDTRGLSGAAFLVVPEGVFGLSGSGDELIIDGRTTRLATPTLQKGAASPYAGMSPPGLAVARASIARDAVPDAVQSLVGPLSSLCARCEREKVGALEKALANELTGNVAVAIHALNVNGRLATEAQRFFAAKQAWLAEVRDGEAAKKAIATLATWPGARTTDEGYALPIEGGELLVGVRGKNLFLANDPKALAAGLGAVPAKGGRQQHGLELALDPARTSQTLAQISFFDVIGSKELAGLFAASTELGPLLAITSAVNGWADSAGGQAHRFGGTWTLKPVARPAASGSSPDAGAAPDGGR